MKPRLSLIASALTTLLASCVVLPIASKTPYPEALLAQLATPGTDKRRVRQLFGRPSETKLAGKFWFYATVRERAGILGSSTAAVVEDYEWLAVQFDDAGRVVFHEFSDDNQGCLSNGICHLKGLFAELNSKTVLTAPTTLDEQAKQYQVKPSECAIYLYQVPKLHLRPGNYPVDFYIDEKIFGTTSYETFLFTTHPAGEVSLRAYQFEKTFRCTPGEVLYIRVIEGWFVKVGEGLDLAPSDAGAEAINKRRLALPE